MLSRIVNRFENLYSLFVGEQQASRTAYRIHNRISDWNYRGGAKADELSGDALAYLTPDNIRLKELEQRYAAVQGMEHSLWGWHTSSVRLREFRGEGDFLTQNVGGGIEPYIASFGYALGLDTLGLFERLSEDTLFMCHTYQILGRQVSRDLLDSVLEIGFLADALGLSTGSDIRVLDIGAGYGRFAHRLVTAFPNAQVRCTDAVPASSFLAEFYLGFRKAAGASILPLDELDAFAGPVDVACNIHSWSECTLQSIRWWLDQLDRLRPRYLFLVPHTEEVLSREKDESRPTFLNEITGRGWRLVLKRPKYHRSALLMEKGLCPTWYFLFER